METINFFSPGRVNIIGEHIDYNGGLVMPIAIAQGISAKVNYTNQPFVKISSKQLGSEIIFDLEQIKRSVTKSGNWSDYALGVIHHLQKEEKEVFGCEIETSSNLPLSSGLSSSAAFEVLVAFILQYNSKKTNTIDLTELAVFCQKVENEFIEVNCGIMDQFAVANGQKGKAMCLDCNTLKHEHIPFELGNYSLVVINSKQPRDLADSAYNVRREQCEQALAVIQQHKKIQNLCEANIEDLNYIKDTIIKQRAKHVVTEQKRVIESIAALKKGNIHTLGKLMTASHISLDKDYEVSSKALDTIVHTAINHKNCLGARLTGAGFGGCCIALVETEGITSFQEEVSNKYYEALSIQADFYITQAEEGVKVI